jgi:asparagine N-glycosylation enzyme membrane subunit Stt3
VFLALIVLLFVPNARLARAQAAAVPGPSDDWHEALLWMRANTPEPFGDPALYFAARFGANDNRRATAYGVTSWWDSGYWIARIARRPPSTNGTQFAVTPVSEFLLAEDEREGSAILGRLRSRYVIVSSEMPVRLTATGQYGPSFLDSAMQVARRRPARYYEEAYRRAADGRLELLLLYYPAYYRTMATRLYAHGGARIRPDRSTYVAVLQDEESPVGVRRVLQRLTRFDTYEDAAAALALDGRARLVGLDPLVSCVPLEPLNTLMLVHSSPTPDPDARPSDGSAYRPSQVQIFEYRGVS